MDALIADLRDQHRRLAHQAEALRAFLEPGRAEADPDGAHRRLVPFGRLLRSHLEMEDRRFYPEALAHPASAALVARFGGGMAHLRDTLEAYLEAWPVPSRIAEDPAGFRDYTAALLRFLERRIQAEETELFPRLAAPPAS